MKKKTILFLLVVFGLVFSTSVSLAASAPTGSFFGGRIVSSPAVEILQLMSAGFICPISGTTITIAPLGSPLETPTSYFIPASTVPQTRTTVRSGGQFILGRYLSQTPISCVHSYTYATTTVYLATINLFGTSR